MALAFYLRDILQGRNHDTTINPTWCTTRQYGVSSSLLAFCSRCPGLANIHKH